MKQEWIALSIVFFTFGVLALRFFRSVLAGPFSRWLLNQGRIKWALFIRKQGEKKPGCSNCK
jgi:hypothetical protein